MAKVRPRRPIPSPRQIAILRLLQEGATSCAELRTRDPTLPRGTIYTTMQRMELAGLLVTHKTWDSDGPRLGLRVTELGIRVLHAVDAFDAVFGHK